MGFSFKSFFGKEEKKSVPFITLIDETTRDGLHKGYTPKYLFDTTFGLPRVVNIPYIRYLARSAYVNMCIETIISEIKSIPWDIVPNDGMEDQADESQY